MLFGRERDEEILRIPIVGMQDLRHLEEVIGRVRAVDYLLIFLGGLGRTRARTLEPTTRAFCI
jgi:hypothetical protein